MLTPDSAQRIGRLLLEEEGDPIRVHPVGLHARPAALGIFLGISLATLHAAVTTGSFAARASVSPAEPSRRTEELPMSTSTTRAAMASAVALSIVASASAQDAVQWRVEDGGNGHWYRLEARTNRDWPTLRTAAEFEGGHLATMTSPQEKSWMLTAIMAGTNCFLGGYQDPNGVEPAGGWRWVTNEPFDWTSWNSGEPNNHPPSGDEDVMGCWASGDWVDVNTIGWAWPCNHAVFEWSADCNNDGVVDYGQIRAGDLADANGNNIPDCCEPGAGACPGDLVRDGRVDGVDLAAVLNNWGLSEGAALNADANCDGVVDGQDLATVLGSWGKCP